MSMPRSIRFLAIPFATLMALGAAGCSSSVSASEVETQISAALQDQIGEAPEEVSCPGDVAAEEGETMRCEITDQDVTYGVTVTITSVEDDVALFDIEVDDEPQS